MLILSRHHKHHPIARPPAFFSTEPSRHAQCRPRFIPASPTLRSQTYRCPRISRSLRQLKTTEKLPCLNESARLSSVFYSSIRPLNNTTGNVQNRAQLHTQDYTIGWICALSLELTAAIAMLDERHKPIAFDDDDITYTLGRIGRHNVVLASLNAGQPGTNSAATVATQMARSFPALRFGLFVGIGGGIPNIQHDIRLGDVVVSQPDGLHSGVVQYDLGKVTPNGGWVRKGSLDAPPRGLLSALSTLQAEHGLGNFRLPEFLSAVTKLERFCSPGPNHDRLYQAKYTHKGGLDCTTCSEAAVMGRKPRNGNCVIVHYGTIASGNRVMKDGMERERLSRRNEGILCFEMEAAGVMNSILKCLIIRGISDYADSHKNDKWHGYAAATASAFTKELLYTLQPKNVHRMETILSSVNKSWDDHIYKSLAFPEMDTRWVMIEKPEEDTCEWIFSDPNYTEWRAGKQKILWIKGKPGSGKSVLMKRIFEVMENESQKSGRYVAKFFINGRGNIMERTMSGLLKSLMFQLLKQHKILLSHVLQRFLDKHLKQGDQLDWEVGELKELLLWGARHGKESIWIIDALDEFAAEELEHLVGFLEDIVATADTTVRVCLSSRRYPNISAKDCFEVDMGVGSYVDIQKFLERKLNDAEKSYRVPKDSIGSLKIQLDDRADGVFLWARLTVEGLLSGIRNGDSLESMSETIKFTPSKLEDIYRELVSDIAAKGSTLETIRLVQWVLYAERPLTLTEIRHALSCDHDIKDDDQMERWIKARARDLIEIRPGKAQGMQAPKIVQFIHQTVKDYFFRLPSLYELQTPFKGLSAGNAQLNLMLNCLMFMRNKQFPTGSQSSKSSRQCSAENRFPRRRQPFWEDSFLEYADQSWLSHAQNAESLGVLPADIAPRLKRLLEDKEKCDQWGYFSCTDQQSKDFKPEGSFIVVAVRYNLLSHVETFLSINRCRGTEGFRESISGHWSLLGTAAGEGFVEMVQLLLRYKVEINPYNPTWSTLGWNWQSPIDEAILNGHRDVVCFLVENGASLATQPDSQKPNPFQVAIMANRASMVELLIHLGADVNAPGFSGQKPIEDAAERGNVDPMRVLLAHNATPTLYALHLAVKNNQREAVNILKGYGIQAHPSDVRWGIGISPFRPSKPASKATPRQQARDIWV